jgi:endo-1,3-1,4-beta-glycanase ExoK
MSSEVGHRITICVVVGLLCMSARAVPAGLGSLTFADEFDGDSLDLTKWLYRSPGARNDGFNTPQAVSVGDGALTIKTYTATDPILGTQNYTGMIATQGLFQQTYGYFEARMKFHTSSGQWGAFWVQSPTIGGTNGAETDGVEMDVIEHRLHDPFDGLVDPNADITNRGHEALIWDGYGANSKSHANLTGPLSGLSNDSWHTWGLKWSPDGYTFYFDDQPVWIQTPADGVPVSHASQYMILSSEVWHTFAGPIPEGGYGSIDNTTTNFQVDYVHVYALPEPAAFGGGIVGMLLLSRRMRRI